MDNARPGPTDEASLNPVYKNKYFDFCFDFQFGFDFDFEKVIGFIKDYRHVFDLGMRLSIF